VGTEVKRTRCAIAAGEGIRLHFPFRNHDSRRTADNRIVLCSDHAAIHLRQAIAVHIAARGWVVVDIGPTTPESTHYPQHGEAAARLVASGDCRFGIVLRGTGQGIMMAANKVKGIRCGVCADTFSALMIRQRNDTNMLSLGVRVIGEGLALDIVDAFLTAGFQGGRHAIRVEMLDALGGEVAFGTLPNRSRFTPHFDQSRVTGGCEASATALRRCGVSCSAMITRSPNFAAGDGVCTPGVRPVYRPFRPCGPGGASFA
jgi:ribose 5-phosphate isomerase B